MENLNLQTKKKIEDIKDSITSKTDLKEIRKAKFGSSTKMNDWLKKNYTYFSSEELEYLEFTIPVEVVNDEEKTTIEVPQNQSPVVKTTDLTTQALLELNSKDKMNFILSDEILALLLDLYKKKAAGIKEELIVPIEYSKLKDLKITNCRLSADIYKRFTKFCDKNNLTITALMNFILDDFLKKNK